MPVTRKDMPYWELQGTLVYNAFRLPNMALKTFWNL